MLDMFPRFVFILLVVSLLGAAQPRPVPTQTRPQQQTPPPPRVPAQPVDAADMPAPVNSPAKMLKYQHEEVKKDMEKLAKLVTEVQEELDKGGENVLSLNTLKKLEEVEKLSRKVRGRIKQ